MWLWHDGYDTELAKMMIERERLLDLEPLHEDVTGAIGEAPIFVLELLVNSLGVGEIIVAHA